MHKDEFEADSCCQKLYQGSLSFPYCLYRSYSRSNISRYISKKVPIFYSHGTITISYLHPHRTKKSTKENKGLLEDFLLILSTKGYQVSKNRTYDCTTETLYTRVKTTTTKLESCYLDVFENEQEYPFSNMCSFRVFVFRVMSKK